MDHFGRIPLGEETFADVVLGLCPGCELWQVDYTHDVMFQYMRMGKPHELHPDTSLWHQLIEDVLTEHLMECRHLQLLLVS